MPAGVDLVQRRTIVVDGCSLSFFRRGTGTPLLFLHGASGIGDWTPWLETLSQSYDVIAPDHPGWGYTESPPWFDNIHDFAYFYLDVIKALGLDDFHLVGNSIGGWLACEIAVRNTSAFKSMTVISPAGLKLRGIDGIDIFLHTPQDLLRAVFYDQSIAEAIIAQPVNDEQIDIALRNRLATARIAWQPRFYDPHLSKWIHRIDVPTLVVWGADDKIFPVAFQSEFVRLIPGAQAATISHAGHLPHIERTDAFMEHFTRFTSSLEV